LTKPVLSFWSLLQGATGSGSRDSSEEPDGEEEEQQQQQQQHQLPSQTPAANLLAAAVPQSMLPTAGGAMLQTALLRSLQHRFATQQALDTPAYLLGQAAGAAHQPAGQEPWRHQQQHQQPGAAGHAAAAMEEEEEAEEEEEEEDGFQIFSQLTYEPTFLSQRPPDMPQQSHDPAGGGGGPDTSQRATQTQQLPPDSQQEQQGAQSAGAGLGAGAHDAAAEAAAAAAADDDDDQEWPASQLLSQPQPSQPHAGGVGGIGDARRASGMSAPSHHKTTPALHSIERVRCDGAGPSGAHSQ
jgi:hypothetical protein